MRFCDNCLLECSSINGKSLCCNATVWAIDPEDNIAELHFALAQEENN